MLRSESHARHGQVHRGADNAEDVDGLEDTDDNGNNSDDGDNGKQKTTMTTRRRSKRFSVDLFLLILPGNGEVKDRER